MNPYSKSKIVDDESSGEEIATEKISWTTADDAFYTLTTFAKNRPCYSAQREMQLHILYSTFLQKREECTKQADIHQVFQISPTRISSLIQRNGSDEARWSVSVRGECSVIGW